MNSLTHPHVWPNFDKTYAESNDHDTILVINTWVRLKSDNNDEYYLSRMKFLRNLSLETEEEAIGKFNKMVPESLSKMKADYRGFPMILKEIKDWCYKDENQKP